MINRIVTELNKRLEGKQYINLNMKDGRTVQVSKNRNIWDGKEFYSANVVCLDSAGYVLEVADDGVIADNLEKVAEYIMSLQEMQSTKWGVKQ